MKGSILDLIPLLIVAVGLIIVIIFVSYSMSQLESNSSESLWDMRTFGLVVDTFQVTFDQGVLVVVVGLGLVAVISAALIPSHPIMLIPTIIIFVFIMLIVPGLGNAFETFTQTPQGTAAIENLHGCGSISCIQLVIQNLPNIFFGIGIMIMIAIFAASRGNGA